MDLLAFERKLDQTIMRKRLDIQEALKRPIKVHADYLPTLFWIYFGHVLPLEEQNCGWASFVYVLELYLIERCHSVSVCSVQQKRKLRIFISNTFNPAKPDAEDGEGTVASWELRVEGRLLEDVSEAFESNSLMTLGYFWKLLIFSPPPQTAVSKYEATKQKRKFSSFFKSLVIELDKDLYGPDNHLVEVRFIKVHFSTVLL